MPLQRGPSYLFLIQLLSFFPEEVVFFLIEKRDNKRDRPVCYREAQEFV